MSVAKVGKEEAWKQNKEGTCVIFIARETSPVPDLLYQVSSLFTTSEIFTMSPFHSALPANCINNNTAGQTTFLGRMMHFSPLVPSIEPQFPRFSGGSRGSFTSFHLVEICSLVFAKSPSSIVSQTHQTIAHNESFLFLTFLLFPRSSGMHMWIFTSHFTLNNCPGGQM